MRERTYDERIIIRLNIVLFLMSAGFALDVVQRVMTWLWN
jgi:hypothetical protein